MPIYYIYWKYIVIYITVISWATTTSTPIPLKNSSRTNGRWRHLDSILQRRSGDTLEARIKLLPILSRLGHTSFERHNPTVSPFASQSSKAIFSVSPQNKNSSNKNSIPLLAKSKFLHLSPAPEIISLAKSSLLLALTNLTLNSKHSKRLNCQMNHHWQSPCTMLGRRRINKNKIS